MRHPAAYYATYWSVKTTIGKGSGLYIVLYLAQFRSFSFFVLPQVSHMFRFWPRVFVRFVVHIGEKRVDIGMVAWCSIYGILRGQDFSMTCS